MANSREVFFKVYHLHVVLIAVRYAKKGTNM